MEGFTILRGKEADDNARFAFLKKRYPTVPFLPTLVATAVPGGPIARDTYHSAAPLRGREFGDVDRPQHRGSADSKSLIFIDTRVSASFPTGASDTPTFQ